MRHWQRLLPPLTILLLILPALQPLFSTDFTCGFDNNFHLWRAIEIGDLLRNGILYSRWAPHMAYGYGFPLFLFQAPLSAYIAAIFNIIGFSWPVAINLTYGLSLLFSAWAMWLLAKDLWGEKGAIVTAIAYSYAPFHAYVLFNRASMSESWAWVFAPLLLWGLRRWQLHCERRGLWTAVLTFTAMMLSHDASTYAIFPLFLGWIIVHWQAKNQRPNLRSLISSLSPLFLGLLASSFFLLPAWLERGNVQFDRVATTWPFRYFDNFLPTSQLLALPRNADPTLLNDWPERGLGVLLVATAVFGLLLTLKQNKHRLIAIYLAIALAGYALLTTAIAQFLWEAIPPLAAFTPWRFLAPASLVAALLSGAIFTERPDRFAVPDRHSKSRPVRSGSIAALLAITAVLTIGHWGWFYPQHCAVPTDTTTQGIINYELATGTIGTTAKRELLPTTVERLVKPEDNARLTSLDEITILQAEHGLLKHTLEIDIAADTTAQFRVLYFSGWRVQIDGETIPISATEPEGWLQFDLPNGRHTLTIQFRETPTWLFADALSILAIGLTWWVGRRKPEIGDQRPETRTSHAPRPTPHVILIGIAIFLFAFKLLIVDKQLIWPRHTVTQIAQQPSTLTFGDPTNPNQIQLLGYDELPNNVPADEPLQLFLYWQAVTAVTQNYRVGLTLTDAQGVRWSEEGLRDYRWTRNPPQTTQWPTTQHAQTAYLLDTLSGTPPGTYTLNLSLFELDTLFPLTIYNEFGQPIGPIISLGSITLTEPNQQWETPEMQYTFDSCCLLGSNIDRNEATPGDTVLFTLFYSTEKGDSQTAVLQLIDDTETAVHTFNLPLHTATDGLWRGQYLLQLPASLEDGHYRWQIDAADQPPIQWSNLQIATRK